MGFIMDQYGSNRHHLTTFSEGPPYRISTKCVKWFMGYMEKFVYDLRSIRLYYGLVWLIIWEDQDVDGWTILKWILER
jgi:hypothetical protein